MPYNPKQPRDPGGQDGGRWIRVDAGYMHATLERKDAGGSERPSYSAYGSAIRNLPVPGEVTLHRPSKTKVSRNGDTSFQVRTGPAENWSKRTFDTNDADEATGQAISFVTDYIRAQKRRGG